MAHWGIAYNDTAVIVKNANHNKASDHTDGASRLSVRKYRK